MTAAFGGVPLVKVKVVALATVSVYAPMVMWLWESVTVMFTVNPPVCVVVPLMSPVLGAIVIPEGNPVAPYV